MTQNTTATNRKKLEELDQVIETTWEEILSQPHLLKFLESLSGEDLRVYALYLIQVYHYTDHNPKNQALVGAQLSNDQVDYIKYCFEHALEETGHELMALHDLRALGLEIKDPAKTMPPPLPETEILIAYLYWVSTQGNLLQRLGYTYWAEQSYHFTDPYLKKIRSNMDLDKEQMTFFYNHASIDEKHAQEVRDILLKVCETEEDWEMIKRTARTTLHLSADIVDGVLKKYEQLVEDEAGEYELLNDLPAP